jgi:phosphohistidine swiveling domain-containing protein
VWFHEIELILNTTFNHRKCLDPEVNIFMLQLFSNSKTIIMERSEIVSLLEVINQQVSSPILGGMEDDYEVLESMGLVKINRESIQWTAVMTPAGNAYLGHD